MDLPGGTWQRHGNDKQGPSEAARRFAEAMRLPVARRYATPREIPYDLHGMKVDFCERPLRAQTPMGERVSIAKSESVPAGATAEFEIECLDPKLEDMVRECLDYGAKRGLGQWRNSGKGRFEWEEIKE